MSQLSRAELERLNELLADEQLDQLSPEDRAELESLRERAGDRNEIENLISGLVFGLEKRQKPSLPPALRAKLEVRGRQVTGTGVGGRVGAGRWWIAAAAMIAVALGAAALVTIQSRTRQAQEAQLRLVELTRRVEENEVLLAAARTRSLELDAALAASQREVSEKEFELAAEAQRQVSLAEKLAAVTADLENAKLTIAKFEEPVDPALLQQNRTLLLEVPGTVRLAWQPFDLPDAPAEQRGVSGDVVWNDEKEEGYLRFVGLAVNDPAKEQYQVWVIDERGMEQKVSGGVFNATAEGEVIVPIHPGIDVRKVKLFAITIEEPGGTWVPDLRRRVVVAPREG